MADQDQGKPRSVWARIPAAVKVGGASTATGTRRGPGASLFTCAVCAFRDIRDDVCTNTLQTLRMLSAYQVAVRGLWRCYDQNTKVCHAHARAPRYSNTSKHQTPLQLVCLSVELELRRPILSGLQDIRRVPVPVSWCRSRFVSRQTNQATILLQSVQWQEYPLICHRRQLARDSPGAALASRFQDQTRGQGIFVHP